MSVKRVFPSTFIIRIVFINCYSINAQYCLLIVTRRVYTVRAPISVLNDMGCGGRPRSSPAFVITSDY